jgi:hypothetical protein
MRAELLERIPESKRILPVESGDHQGSSYRGTDREVSELVELQAIRCFLQWQKAFAFKGIKPWESQPEEVQEGWRRFAVALFFSEERS